MSADDYFHTMKTIAAMTPIDIHPKIQVFNSQNVDTNHHHDDDDDVLYESLEGTNQKSHTLLPLLPVDIEGLQVLDRCQLAPNDVVLGRGSNDKGLFPVVLKNWWERYNNASHSNKRNVTREAIREMYTGGVRFINRVDDGSRNGSYAVEPLGSARVERKVLRSLRQEVLNQTVYNITPPRALEVCPSLSVPVKSTSSKVRNKASIRSVKTKTKSKNRPLISTHMMLSKQKNKKYAPQEIKKDGSKYIPILPSSLRPQHNVKIVVPPPMVVLPPSPRILPPPAMGMNSSLGSVIGPSKGSNFSLIPSAINFGTSDLAGGATSNSHATTLFPPTIAASPDTVLPSDYFTYLTNSFGKGMINDSKGTTNVPTFSQRPSLSTGSIDFSRIFDTVVDTVVNDVDVKTSPPALTGRQSSMFSAVSFKEWSQKQHDKDRTPEGVDLRSEKLAIPAVVPYSINTECAGNDGYLDLSQGKMIESLDRSTIFDESFVPLSPTPMYYNITNEVEHIVQGNMPYITPMDTRYDPASRTTRTPTRTTAKRNACDEFDGSEAEQYQALCNKLEDSMAKLESEEIQHKNWEAHNEGLWRHFIQEQPDLAKMLSTRGRNSSMNESQGPPSTVQLPPRAATSRGRSGSLSTFDSRSTSPVPLWFYNDANSCDNSCSGHQSVTIKWQQLFASDNDEIWEEV